MATKSNTAKNEDQASTLRLLVAIARAFKAVDDRIKPGLAAHGLSVTEFAVLEALLHKGPLPLGELSERILVTGASTTYTVKNLEKRDLMSRKQSPLDQRVVMGDLTVAGRKLMGLVFPEHAGQLQAAMAGLSRKEKDQAADLLRKLRKYLQ